MSPILSAGPQFGLVTNEKLYGSFIGTPYKSLAAVETVTVYFVFACKEPYGVKTIWLGISAFVPP